MSDMYSSSTSFEYLNDEENNSNGSNGQVNSSIINQYERPGDSNEDGNIDIQSLSNSVTSENDLWTFYEKDANRDSEEPNVSKSDRILRCLLKSDVKGLRKLGREKNGFISDSLRRLVWPRLAKAEVVESVPKPSREQLENLETYNVICKDVIRTCFYQEVDEITRESWQDQLRRLVARIMVKNPDFHYFQGYHEICLIFLMVLGEEMAFHTMNSVSRTHLRKFLTGRDERLFKEEAERQFDLIYLIIGEEEPKLREFLEAAEFYPSYLIAWILTWFAHNVKGYKNIVRLLDLFLVSDPLMPLYLSAAILLHKKDDILTLECSFEEVYYFINKIWEREEEISLEDLICNARSLMSKYSPEKLTELHASRVKQLSQRKQRSALSNILHLVRQSSSLRMLSIPVAVIIVAYIYQNYLTN